MAKRDRLRDDHRSVVSRTRVSQEVRTGDPPDAPIPASGAGRPDVLRNPLRAPRLPRVLHELRWRLVLARFAVSLAAVALTIAIFPGMRIGGTFWVWILVLGAVFGVLNAFVKPVLQVLMIRYLFVSYGLVVFAIYVALFWLLDVLTAKHLEIDGFWNLLGGGIVAGLFVILFENLLGTTPPVVDSRRPDAAAER